MKVVYAFFCKQEIAGDDGEEKELTELKTFCAIVLGCKGAVAHMRHFCRDVCCMLFVTHTVQAATKFSIEEVSVWEVKKETLLLE